MKTALIHTGRAGHFFIPGLTALLLAFALLSPFQCPAGSVEHNTEVRADAPDSAGASPEPGLFQRLGQSIEHVWHSPTIDLYVPFYTWHNRLVYDSDKVGKYNENPWGGGIGRSYYDEDGDWHGLFVMGFMDSNDKFQPYGGYAFIKNWGLGEEKDLKLGIGYTLGLTARDEYNYIPIPLPLPLLSISYKMFAIQGAYVPGGFNDGNVLFLWARWQLN